MTFRYLLRTWVDSREVDFASEGVSVARLQPYIGQAHTKRYLCQQWQTSQNCLQ